MYFHKSLVKAIILYIILIVSLNFLFGFIYWKVSSNAEINSLVNWFYFSTNGTGGIKPEEPMWLWMSFHYLFTSLIISISTGFIFYFILNRPPKIIFPEKLILRKREKDETFALTIKIANRGKKKLYEVKIKLFYIYFVKRHDGALVRDAKTHFEDSVPYVEKVYRFSFDLTKFPEDFFDSILEKFAETNLKEGLKLNNRVSIVVYGKYGRFGEDFMVERDYYIRDIEIAKDTALLHQYSYENGKIVQTKTNWDNLNEIIYYSKEEFAEIIKSLKTVKNSVFP